MIKRRKESKRKRDNDQCREKGKTRRQDGSKGSKTVKTEGERDSIRDKRTNEPEGSKETLVTYIFVVKKRTDNSKKVDRRIKKMKSILDTFHHYDNV